MYLVKEKSSPYYQIIYMVDGRRNKRSTKCKFKSEALKFLSEFEKHFAAQKITKYVILSEFELEYKQYVKRTHSVSSQKSIHTSFSMFHKFIADQQLRKIDRKQIDIFLNETTNSSKSAAGLYYRTLKAAFNKALEWNYIIENPFAKIKPPRMIEKFPIFIEEDLLLEINNGVKEQFLRDFYITGFHTGMRAGEICNLRWSAIDLEQRIITVQNTESFTTKSKRERIIPINDTLMEVLKNMYPKVISILRSDLVFCRVKGIKLNVDYVSKKFKKVIRELNLDEKIHLHVLRHSFASNLIQRGVSLYVVKELLGHSSVAVTQKYAHLQRSNLFDAVRKLNKKVI